MPSEGPAVHLAQDLDGRRVAVKLIRSGPAADPEFRARFRSEVNRARQVPPFCTAADIFAWGVLVAYASTGRTPFAADNPVGKIRTQEPDLTGLSGPIRDLAAVAG
ncbi:hypothetical protein [Paractinoplanes durhamensis]|uniref:Serine/threonine protein kinase n=1 Tax=Paractinoplanes durhamensis TaxID=113563 RepID=A0ABQ3Z4G9_9ACTN|nr:hypothetical protein [Actinoplanes durhamensis]GIE04725.1 hypothetical protein Adu01nite_60750 [Actinoplanes durhamensis]